jgi:SnoaL-like protein
MPGTLLVKAAIAAWETSDVQRLSSCLSDDFLCWNLLPQLTGKQGFLHFMQAMMRAFPDWSWSANFLNEHATRDGRIRVHVAVRISGTHAGDLVLAGLPVIPPTGIRIALPPRHMHFTVNGELIDEVELDSKPNLLEEVLFALGMRLP